jgi:hypothetical protein
MCLPGIGALVFCLCTQIICDIHRPRRVVSAVLSSVVCFTVTREVA